LRTPFTPRLIDPEKLTSTEVLAALERTPDFARAWAPEKTLGNLEAITEMGRLLLDQPEQLWSRESARFNNNQAPFDLGVRQMRQALLDDAVIVDVAGFTSTEVPASTPPATMLVGAAKVEENTETRPVLQMAMLIVHELLNEGVGDPTAALQTALVEANS
jgi:hypothetical protein